MQPKSKYWLFIFAIALVIFLVIGFGFLATVWNLDSTDREVFEAIIGKLIPLEIISGVVIFAIVGGMVSLLFRSYIIPILQLSEETGLISSVNVGHRIALRGASEVQQLISTINKYADEHEKLQTDVDEKISNSRIALDAERNRLAALMSEIPNGVVVCNIDGQILLYNPQAQKFLSTVSKDGVKAKPIGLGRSIFALVERNPILHCLDVLQQAISSGKQDLVTGFMLPLGEHYLRFNMAPVFERSNENKNMTGFVLTIEDIAPEIESDTRLESWLQQLIDDIEGSLLHARNAITTILGNPGMEANELATHRQTIDSETVTIKKRLDRTREEAARNIHTVTRREEVLGQHFFAVLSKHLEDRFGIISHATITGDGWLNLDSYMAVQGIAFLAGRLKKRSGIDRLDLDLVKMADHLSIGISWAPDRVRKEDVDSWQRTPMITDRLQHTFSFRDFIARHDGQIQIPDQNDEFCNGINLLLPFNLLQEEFSAETEFEQRPIFYEFDLFNSRGLESLGAMPLRSITYVPFDLETTGLEPNNGDEIIQLGAIRVVRNKLQYNETVDQLVDPQRSLPPIATKITGISAEMLVGQPTVKEVMPEFKAFSEHSVLVAHNAAFDMRFLELSELRTGISFKNPVLDTLLLSSVVHPNLDDHTLDGLAERMNIPIVGRHTALGDAIVTAEILIKLIPLLEAQGITTLGEAITASAGSKLLN